MFQDSLLAIGYAPWTSGIRTIQLERVNGIDARHDHVVLRC
jgi:hypothetical protein